MPTEEKSRGEAAFRTTDIPPPSPYYISNDDVLVAAFTTSITGTGAFVLSCRILRPDGVITPVSIPFSVGLSPFATTNREFRLTEGYLLSVEFTTNASSQVGQVFVSVHLGRTVVPGTSWVFYGTLCSGFAFSNHGPSWPVVHEEPCYPENSALSVVTGTDPAAGVEISEFMPALREITAITFSLVCDATVATRTVNLVLDDASGIFYRRLAEADLIATQTGTFVCAHNGYVGRASLTVIQIDMPPKVTLALNQRFRTITTNLQAGDNFSAPVFHCRQWLMAR